MATKPAIADGEVVSGGGEVVRLGVGVGVGVVVGVRTGVGSGVPVGVGVGVSVRVAIGVGVAVPGVAVSVVDGVGVGVAVGTTVAVDVGDRVGVSTSFPPPPQAASTDSINTRARSTATNLHQRPFLQYMYPSFCSVTLAQSGISHINSGQRRDCVPSPPAAIICPLQLAVKPDAMTIKDLGRWESIEMVQRYTLSVTFHDSLKFYKALMG